MLHRLSAALLVALVVTAGPVADAASPSPGVETVMLDTRSDSGRLPSVQTSRLQDKTFYVMTVSGTISAWKSADLPCGKAVPIRYPSPGKPDGGLAGVDAETFFAGPSFACGREWPRHTTNFRIDTGTGPEHLEPMGGHRSAPDPSHTYSYLVKGTGGRARLSLQFSDKQLGDNSGMFRVDIRPAAPADCRGDAWKAFDSFSNQRQCVRALLPAA